MIAQLFFLFREGEYAYLNGPPVPHELIAHRSRHSLAKTSRIFTLGGVDGGCSLCCRRHSHAMTLLSIICKLLYGWMVDGGRTDRTDLIFRLAGLALLLGVRAVPRWLREPARPSRRPLYVLRLLCFLCRRW